MGLEGPSRQLDVAPYNVENSLEACGHRPVGRPEPTDTLYAGYRDISSGHLRQLMTFGSEQQAQAYADAIASVFGACPQETDGQGVRKVYRVSDQPGYGDSAVSVAMRYEVGNQPGPGARVVEVVRVGQAVLLTVLNDEAAELDDDAAADALATQYLESSGSVLDAMGA